MNKLNLGCGNDYKEGYVNIDNDPNVKTDWCGDGCNTPFDNDYFDHVYSHHVLEHFDCLFSIVDELGRICKDGATMEIITPYATWTAGWANPHHKLFFDERTFRFFDKGKNGIHKRREQDYSIETVGVEYRWNEDFCNELYADNDLTPYELRTAFLNTVKAITYNLICHKH